MEIEKEHQNRPNLESLKRNNLNMNNTAMNFNSSLFDKQNKIPDGHFDDIEDDVLDIPSKNDFNGQRSRVPTIVTQNADTIIKTNTDMTEGFTDLNK